MRRHWRSIVLALCCSLAVATSASADGAWVLWSRQSDGFDADPGEWTSGNFANVSTTKAACEDQITKFTGIPEPRIAGRLARVVEIHGTVRSEAAQAGSLPYGAARRVCAPGCVEHHDDHAARIHGVAVPPRHPGPAWAEGEVTSLRSSIEASCAARNLT